MLPEQQTGLAPAERLWAYVTGVYADAAVAKACLQVQDAHGFDVNVLLFAAWCAREGRRLDVAQLEAAESRCGAWRAEVVQALRRTRRRWKGLASRAADYEAIKELELSAERRQLSMLAEVSAGPVAGAAPDAAAATVIEVLAGNLAAVAAARGEDPAVLGDLRQALAAATQAAQSAARKPPD